MLNDLYVWDVIYLKLRKLVINILIFILIFILTFYYTCFLFHVSGDEIWNFGFSYNIFKGMIPYRDFNMIVTPFYSFFGCFFLQLFGTYLYSFHIMDAILMGFIVLMLFKMIRYRVFIIYPFLLFWCIPSYNFLCLFFLFLIIFLNYEDRNEYFISFSLSLLFLTKQTVGICLFIPFFFYCKNKVKSFALFLIPIIVFLLYLILNGALYNFVDYCFLGMFDFGAKNASFSIFFVLEISAIIYLVCQMIRKPGNRQELFYILAFQIMAFPIMDFYHFLIAIIPVIYYLLKEIKQIKISLGIASFVIFVFCCFLSLLFEKEITYYKYNNFLDYRVDIVWSDSSDNSLTIEEQIKLVNKYYGDGNNFLFMRNAYLIKLFLDEPINKFDIINNGNMGYHGVERYIKEMDDICSNDDCIFIIDNSLYKSKIEITQMNQDILDYVYSNYNIIDNYKSLDVFSN